MVGLMNFFGGCKAGVIYECLNYALVTLIQLY